MRLKDFLNKLVYKIPVVARMRSELKEYARNTSFPPGHFYSPIVAVDDIRRRENSIWHPKNEPGPEIQMRTEKQLELLKDLEKYYEQQPFMQIAGTNLRYNFDNEYFSYSDGILLYSILRHIKPSRIIEVGSGYSSALMIDVNQYFFSGRMEITFIEPYPDRLQSLLQTNDLSKYRILEERIQAIPVNVFKELEAGDVLFIDSSHVSKTGSDVNYLFFQILPILSKGVIIHLHDIGEDFEYPREIVFSGKNWNESYLLRAFLMYNRDYEVLLHGPYMHARFPEAFNNMSLASKNSGGSFWMVKV